MSVAAMIGSRARRIRARCGDHTPYGTVALGVVENVGAGGPGRTIKDDSVRKSGQVRAACRDVGRGGLIDHSRPAQNPAVSDTQRWIRLCRDPSIQPVR